MPPSKATSTAASAGPVPDYPSGGEHRLITKALPLLWYSIIALVLFGQSIHFDYTCLDDQNLILNQLERYKSARAIFTAFGEDVFRTPAGNGLYYRPILTVSFIVDTLIGGGQLSVFHASNIVYHIAATYLLFLLFLGLSFDRARSFLFALLFLVHPVLNQAVAWVPGRNDSLLAIFVFGSFLSWLQFTNTRQYRYLPLHLILFALALFTKESALALPVMIVLYSAVAVAPPRKIYAWLIPTWAVIIVGWHTLRHRAAGGVHTTALSDQLLSIVTNSPALLPYLGKAFFPVQLSVFPIMRDMTASLILGVIALALIAVLIGRTAPRQRLKCLFGTAWFGMFLLPSFVTLNDRIPNYAEHRSYVPLAGILMILIACDPLGPTRFRAPIFRVVAASIVLAFCVLTLLHLRAFQDRFTFWRSAVQTSPTHAFNYNNLGATYQNAGDPIGAEPYLRQALKLNPREPVANFNLGLLCAYTNRPQEAELFYIEEIKANPTFDHAYFYLGLLYFNMGQYNDASEEWEQLIHAVNPSYQQAYQMLLNVYGKQGRKDDYERISRRAREYGVPVQ